MNATSPRIRWMNLSSPLVIIAVCHVIARLSGDWLTGLAWLPAQAAYWILLGAMGESNDGVPRAIGQLLRDDLRSPACRSICSRLHPGLAESAAKHEPHHRPYPPDADCHRGTGRRSEACQHRGRHQWSPVRGGGGRANKAPARVSPDRVRRRAGRASTHRPGHGSARTPVGRGELHLFRTRGRLPSATARPHRRVRGRGQRRAS
jgi:hypothetical protein